MMLVTSSAATTSRNVARIANTAGGRARAKKDVNHRATENTEKFIEFVFNSVLSVAQAR